MYPLCQQDNYRFIPEQAGKRTATPPDRSMPEAQALDLTDFVLGLNRFVLRVPDDAMAQAGILVGDMAVIERGERATDGDIVIALIDHEVATLRRLQRNDDSTLTLHPANAAMAPLRYSTGRVEIQGRLVGLMRRYR